tara:strand:+ start:710 stop:1078 length:369 start_codon:yes stop_codon:yes gene_type:complete
MEEINNIILKEKQKDQPNKDYIQWLQQLSDKKLTENFIAEVKQKKFLEDLYKQNTIELNDYFKYSGKTEETKGVFKQIEENNKEYEKFIQQNPKANILGHRMHMRWLNKRFELLTKIEKNEN